MEHHYAFLKTVLTVLALAIGAVSAMYGQQETISMNGIWQFKAGDDLRFAQPTFDDAAWDTLRADKIWEEQGYEKLDGYAWFRLTVFLPASLRESATLTDGLRICLGKINNFDQSFLNGTIIGINGKSVAGGSPIDTLFTKAEPFMWNYERVYVLPFDDPRLKWNAENVFAVRVYDEGGQGGMWSGTANMRAVNIKDYLMVNPSSQPFEFKGVNLTKAFGVKNISANHPIRGVLAIEAFNGLTAEREFNKTIPMTITPGKTENVSFALNQPKQSLTVRYTFQFEDYRETMIVSEQVPYVLTPPTSDKPLINGPAIYGARPGKPFLFAVAATGVRPMIFSARNLPDGLSLDPQTGIITGRPVKKGSSVVTVTAQNAKGKENKNITFVIGDAIALTPPLGWNSWNAWGLSVDQEKVLASARTFKEKGLMNHGWSFINVDDGWEIKGDSPMPKRDAEGNILVNEKFPNMKAMGDSIHSMGLKFGIYSSPGPLTCGGYTASYQYELNDARSYAHWGVDYLKYDWCSYDKIAKDHSRPELIAPYTVMRSMLDQVDRDIVYSLCQYGMGDVWEWGKDVGGNLWRTTGDITDTWESLSGIGFNQIANSPYAGPGHWNDPDMLVVGWVGWGPNLHPTGLTPDEQYTHISLWSLLSAPLLIGCDLTRLDAFTLNLLTNDEVLAVDQDPLGKQATPVVKDGDIQVWVKELSDGTKAFGLFNLGKTAKKFSLPLKQIGLEGKVWLRDLWRQKNLGGFSGTFETLVPSHGVVLVRSVKER